MKEDMRKLMNLFESSCLDKVKESSCDVEESSCMKEESECLTEALGNLVAVSPKLLQNAKKQVQDFRDNVGGSGMIKERVIRGRDLAQALREIDEKNTAGIVIGRYGSGEFEQMFLFAKNGPYHWRMVADPESTLPSDVTKFYSESSDPKGIQSLYGWLNALRKLESFKDGNELSLMIIGKDAARKDVQADRRASRSGSVLTPSDPGYKKFIKELKTSLRDRLNEFKKAKAAGVETPEDFVDYIKQNGFVDKIKIGEFVYERLSSSGSFDKMISGQDQDDAWSQFIITYRVEHGDYVKARKAAALKITGGSLPTDEQEEEAKKSLPPRQFDIRLGQVSPGMFGPVSVKVSDFP